ncbi:MAG TPA: hydroxymethylglutaryl-CoA reductase [Thermoanaerobaculia bacterium]|nr:hydroxymethylglutaryl-CoA reductase [Thermoanaerobaculia bacterium]
MSKINPVVRVRSPREELVQALVDGELGFHQLPRDLPAHEAAEIRRHAIEAISGASLEKTGAYALDDTRAACRNCENFVGAAQVPVGVVGPVSVRGEAFTGETYALLATSEAALVASTNRGCAAIRRAGGARVWVEDVGMTRAPVFRTAGIDQTRSFLDWVAAHEDEIREIAEGTSEYLKLLDIRPYTFGTTIYLRFRFTSGDAMGMNMATIACDRVVREFIEPVSGVECVALSGNYCVDKKPAAINFQEGRGKRVFAEVLLPKEILSQTLKTNAQALLEVQYRKNLLGSIASGSAGFNAHFANVLAAFFIACGQDLAHVVEGSMGVTCVEAREDDAIYASIYLPAVPLGAVGGGTGLDTQAEALAMMGVEIDPERPGHAVHRLAEILGATVLAGELSLLAAFTSDDLARAHERLGRGAIPPGGPLAR